MSDIVNIDILVLLTSKGEDLKLEIENYPIGNVDIVIGFLGSRISAKITIIDDSGFPLCFILHTSKTLKEMKSDLELCGLPVDGLVIN